MVHQSVLSFVVGSDIQRLEEEDASGRFHSNFAFRREIFDRSGGWSPTKRGDFDLQLIARQHAIEAPRASSSTRRISFAGARRTHTSVRRSCRDRKKRVGMMGREKRGGRKN